MYWEKDVETLSRNKLEELQLAQLIQTVKRTEKSYYYGKLFKEVFFFEEFAVIIRFFCSFNCLNKLGQLQFFQFIPAKCFYILFPVHLILRHIGISFFSTTAQIFYQVQS